MFPLRSYVDAMPVGYTAYRGEKSVTAGYRLTRADRPVLFMLRTDSHSGKVLVAHDGVDACLSNDDRTGDLLVVVGHGWLRAGFQRTTVGSRWEAFSLVDGGVISMELRRHCAVVTDPSGHRVRVPYAQHMDRAVYTASASSLYGKDPRWGAALRTAGRLLVHLAMGAAVGLTLAIYRAR